MKKLKESLILLLLISSGAKAQETKKWEIGLNTGAIFSKHQDQSGDSRWIFRDNMFLVNDMSLSAYQNFNRFQVGLRVDGGTMGGRDWWISPQAVANYKIPFSKLYVYGGGVAGYVTERVSRMSHYPAGNGFVTGLQAGTVIFPGKRIGINLETGVRFNRMYREVTFIDPDQGIARQEVKGFTETYVPLSLGIRYRFN